MASVIVRVRVRLRIMDMVRVSVRDIGVNIADAIHIYA